MNDLLEGLLSRVPERRHLRDARIRKQNVEFAEMLCYLSKEMFSLRSVADVRSKCDRVRPQFLRGRVQCRLISSGDRYLCSFRNEETRSCQSNAAITSGNECRFPF